MRFEEIDHTADVGIRAYGQSLDELFANVERSSDGTRTGPGRDNVAELAVTDR